MISFWETYTHKMAKAPSYTPFLRSSMSRSHENNKCILALFSYVNIGCNLHFNKLYVRFYETLKFPVKIS